ncbi:MAG: IS256 family transposase, partial [Thermomicrobiales bacterium]
MVRGLVAAAQAALLDDPAFLRGLVQDAVQAVLEAEMAAHLGAGRYERTAGRTGHRNGYKPRTLRTRVGTLERQVPQDRDGPFATEVFARYQRTEQALVLTLLEMDVQGGSTRKVTAITEQLCGTSFSKSQVSALAGRRDVDLAAWRERPLAAADPSLSVDARYAHVRIEGQVVSQGVLIVAGVRDDGRRELLAVEVADTESAATYEALFRRLTARGLHGVRLVTSDDHAGLRAAIARHVQGAGWQRCQVHVARNVQGRVGPKHRAQLAEDVRAIFAAPDAAQARATARTCAERWQRSHPTVATQLEEELEPCLACYAAPAAHRPRVRTTNGLERFHQELKRRTRVVRIFPNRAALRRLVTALAMEQSEEWGSGRRSLDREPLGETPASSATLVAQAASLRRRRRRPWRSFTELLGLD